MERSGGMIVSVVRFYDSVDDALLKFAVIVSRHSGTWVFCKHKKRDTYECPGGHREAGEQIEQTAQRELWEETGASRYDMRPVAVYSVETDGVESFGMLYAAEIYAFEPLPQLEIEKIEFLAEPPTAWTYPLIQPQLLEKASGYFDVK